MKTKVCKFCGRSWDWKSGHKDFCSTPHYQSYRYKTNASVREKIKRGNKIRRRARYSEDAEYRAREIAYSRAWQAKHPDRVRELARNWKRTNKK